MAKIAIIGRGRSCGKTAAIKALLAEHPEVEIITVEHATERGLDLPSKPDLPEIVACLEIPKQVEIFTKPKNRSGRRSKNNNRFRNGSGSKFF